MIGSKLRGYIDTRIPQNYNPSLDIIRIVACFFVIMIHVATHFFSNFSPVWPIALVYDAMARVAVPIFFMITGYLLLDIKILSLGNFYTKRFTKIIVPFIITCIIYYFLRYRQYSLVDYIIYISNNYVDYHLWYIYTLIGIYLSLPFFIYILCDNKNITYAFLYFFIWLMFYLLPNQFIMYYNIKCDYFSRFNLGFFGGYMGYVVCGIIIKKINTFINKKYALFLYILSTVLIIALTYKYSYRVNKPSELFFVEFTPLIFIQSTSLFILLLNMDVTPRFNKILYIIADKTYWIYLIHILVLGFIFSKFPLHNINLSLLIYIPFWTILTMIVCCVLAFPLKMLENFIHSSLIRLIGWLHEAPILRK